MTFRFFRWIAPVAAMLALGATSRADSLILTQWNFNGPSAAGASPDPNIGSGTWAPVGGVTSPGFNSGAANGGSSDPAGGAPPNYALQTTNYAAQGTGDRTAGVRFNVSTVGFTNISLSYDLRHSNTSSRYEQVQYTIDGTTWIDVALFDGNAGDTWFNNRTVGLGGVAGVDDNPNFGFRVVAAFAPNTATYLASNPNSTYAASGTWRFDMVTITASVIPEPGSIALAGIGAVALSGFGLRRRKRA